MRTYNQIQMKTYEQMLPQFSNEPGLEYVDKFEYSNHSVYRGQMKKVDESVRAKLVLSDNNSVNNRGAGAL